MAFIPLLILAAILASIGAFALPTQPAISYIKNETSNSSGIGQARDGDEGGYITTINLNATQQNFRWKAYVGNVTGQLILEDSDQYSIYQWDMQLNALGNVYISRNGTVDWNTINCTNQTEKVNEDNFLNNNPSISSSINMTFNSTIHKAFSVSGKPYANSTCYAIATNINDSSQILNESAKFQELLLSDNSANLVYMTIMEQNIGGFDNDLYDFQAIVAEDESAPTPTRYYFYVELNG